MDLAWQNKTISSVEGQKSLAHPLQENFAVSLDLTDLGLASRVAVLPIHRALVPRAVASSLHPEVETSAVVYLMQLFTEGLKFIFSEHPAVLFDGLPLLLLADTEQGLS